jgi:hypothetical protein
MESMALVLVDQIGSTKQVFLIFFHNFACSFTVFSCHLYEDRQKYGEYSMTSLPERLKSHNIYVNHFHESCSGQLLG